MSYELKIYKRIDGKSAPPELKAVRQLLHLTTTPRIQDKISRDEPGKRGMNGKTDICSQVHPLGKSPVLTLDNQVLAESAFIIDHLTTRFGGSLRPPSSDIPSMLDFQYLLHYAEGTCMPPLTIGYIMQSIKNASVPFFVKPITSMIVSRVYESYLTPTYDANFGFLENWLAGEALGPGAGADGGKEHKDMKVEKDYFVGQGKGEFSAVDILLSYPLMAAQKGRVQGFDEVRYPRLFAWMGRVKLREAFKRAEERTREFEPEELM